MKINFSELRFSKPIEELEWVNQVAEVFNKKDFPRIAMASLFGDSSAAWWRRLGDLWCLYHKAPHNVRFPHCSITSLGMFGTIGLQTYLPGELVKAQGGVIVFSNFDAFNQDIKDRMLTFKESGYDIAECAKFYSFQSDWDGVQNKSQIREDLFQRLNKQLNTDGLGGHFDLVLKYDDLHMIEPYQYSNKDFYHISTFDLIRKIESFNQEV